MKKLYDFLYEHIPFLTRLYSLLDYASIEDLPFHILNESMCLVQYSPFIFVYLLPMLKIYNQLNYSLPITETHFQISLHI